MPNPRQVARGLGERLREVALPTARGVSQISASIGVVPLSEPPGASVDRALQCAGDAMYSAKAAGRDQWLLAHSQDPGVDAAQMGVQLAKRSRQLALANALGARLDAMTELVEIAILANQVAAAIRSAQLVQPVGAT